MVPRTSFHCGQSGKGYRRDEPFSLMREVCLTYQDSNEYMNTYSPSWPRFLRRCSTLETSCHKAMTDLIGAHMLQILFSSPRLQSFVILAEDDYKHMPHSTMSIPTSWRKTLSTPPIPCRALSSHGRARRLARSSWPRFQESQDQISRGLFMIAR